MFIRIIIGIMILFYSLSVNAGDWRSKYKNNRGISCCGEADCKKVPMSRVTKGVCGFMVDGKCIPRSHIKPSEDKNYWHCPIFDCFFVPGMVS